MRVLRPFAIADHDVSFGESEAPPPLTADRGRITGVGPLDSTSQAGYAVAGEVPPDWFNLR